MVDEIPELENLFSDLNHPNPNINRKAFESMRRFWPDQSLVRLIQNLDSQNIELRRKSVQAISCFGTDIVSKIVKLFFSSDDKNVRISCLKILTIIGSNYNLSEFEQELKSVITFALKDESAEMILIAVSLLRQIGKKSLPCLKLLCRDENLLKAKAAITALLEIPDPSNESFLVEISNDSSLDKLIRDEALDFLKSS